MRLTETLKSLGRRWYVVLLGLAITASAGMLISDKVPVTYAATGSILLMPPDETVGDRGNPYLYLGGLNTALDVLVRRANSIEVSGPLMELHPGSTYTVEPDRTTSSAIVLVTAEAGTSDAAFTLRDEAMATVMTTLDLMQDEANVENVMRLHGQDLVIDKKSVPKTKTRLQLILVAVGGGIVGTLLLAGVVDGWIIERRHRRLDTPEPEPAEEDAGPEPRKPTDAEPDPESGPRKPAESAPSMVLLSADEPAPHVPAARRGDKSPRKSRAHIEESSGTPLKVP